MAEKRGDQLFVFAATHEYKDIENLYSGAHPNIRDIEKTPLHVACEQMNEPDLEKTVTALLNKGANPNMQDKTPLHKLCVSADPKVTDTVEILLEWPDERANPNITNNLGITPLHLAVKAQNLQVTRLLLRAGANPNLRIAKTGQTALSIATQGICQVLDWNPNSERWKELDAMLGKDNKLKETFEIFQALLDKDADPNIKVTGITLGDRRRILDMYPLAVLVRLIIVTNQLMQDPTLDRVQSLKPLQRFLLLLAKQTIDHKADINISMETNDPKSILVTIVDHELEILIQHPVVQTELETKWGPRTPNSYNWTTHELVYEDVYDYYRWTWWEYIHENLKSARFRFYGSAAFFLVLLCVYTSMCILNTSSNDYVSFTQIQGMKERFVVKQFPRSGNPSIPKSFNGIEDPDDVYSWLKGPFLDGIFPDDNDENLVNTYNKLWTWVILRQLRTKKQDCQNGNRYDWMGNSCYSYYNDDTEDTKPYGPPGNSTMFTYTEPSVPDKFMSPLHYWYPIDGGYITKIYPTNKTEANETIYNLEQNGWIDEGTAAVFVEFVVYNGNINRFVISRLYMEFAITGKISPVYTFDRVKLNIFAYGLGPDRLLLALEIIFLLLLTSGIVSEVYQIWEERRHYVRNMWNILDFLLYTLFLLAVGIRAVAYVYIYSLDRDKDFTSETNQYVKLTQINILRKREIDVGAVLIIFMWAILLKYIRIFPRCGILLRVIRKMFFNVISFVVVYYGLIFASYGLSFHLLLGTEAFRFRTWGFSMLALFRMITGDFQWSEIEEPRKYVAYALFIIHMLVAGILLLNILIAILNQAYNEVVEKAKSEWYSEWASIILSYTRGRYTMANAGAPPAPDNNKYVFLTDVSVSDDAPQDVEQKFYSYERDLDTNGIIYNLGTAKAPKVFASSVDKKKGIKPEHFITRKNVYCWTKNKPDSWFCVDFGDRRVCPTHYTLRYASTGSFCCPRSWELQGANPADPDTSPRKKRAIAKPSKNVNANDLENLTWEPLSVHENDQTLNGDFATHTWRIDTSFNPNGTYYRYFRIIMTGPNSYPATEAEDLWSNVLVAGGFELYGSVEIHKEKSLEEAIAEMEASPKVEVQLHSSKGEGAATQTGSFVYNHDMDTNGCIYFLGGYPNVQVIASGVAEGKKVKNFILRNEVHSWTSNEPFSWFCVDIGKERAIWPSHYTLRYGSTGSFCCPRNWVLQGSNQFTKSKEYADPTTDPNWTTLSTHVNDTSLNSEYATKTWKLDAKASEHSYRYFRVVQTGKNSYTPTEGTADSWSNVLVASGFELYGKMSYIPSSLKRKGKEEATPDEKSNAEKNVNDLGMKPFIRQQLKSHQSGVVEELKDITQTFVAQLREAIKEEITDIKSSLETELAGTESGLKSKMQQLQKRIPVSDWDYVFASNELRNF